MTSMYELGILGTLPKDVLHTIQAELESQIHELGLSIPDEVSIYSGAPSGFKPTGSRCSAAICSKCDDGDNSALSSLLDKGIPIIPVATALRNFSKEVPALLSPLNGLALDTHSAFQISTALLECATLLPRQRHVFISYRRDNGSEAALQLYSSLSARGFDIFLDTHKLHPGEHFQEVLWQRLCDCDVLLMLDTDRYFDSRWTNAEFGRAMSRGLAFVRVGWPGISLNPRAGAAVNLQLDSSHFETAHSLKPVALASIAEAVEMARTKSVAMRYQSLVDTLKASVSRIGGRLNGVSIRKSIVLTLADGKTIAIYPTLGVPTSQAMHDATLDQHPPPVAVVYDDIGLTEKNWRAHMDWLDPHLRHMVRLVASYKAGWDFSDWN